jgi:uncharacterized protein YmfQ (DUF2313 family)
VVVDRAMHDALEEARALLPTGEAWPTEPGTNLERLLAGLSAWRGRIEARGLDLLLESDPRTATELLAKWEEALGLPDACLPAPASLLERRALVVSRIVGPGGGSRSFFVQLAAALGFQVTITERTVNPFRMGRGRMGDALSGERGGFIWQVHSPITIVRRAAMGRMRMGDPLATWGNQLLECVFRRAAPAHTLVQFTYGASCAATFLDENGDPIGVYQVGDEIHVLDENGELVRLLIVEGELVVYDENGDPVAVPIICES